MKGRTENKNTHEVSPWCVSGSVHSGTDGDTGLVGCGCVDWYILLTFRGSLLPPASGYSNSNFSFRVLLFVYLKDGGNMLLRNVSNKLPISTVSQHTRPLSSFPYYWRNTETAGQKTTTPQTKDRTLLTANL
jgi:hypothetical protein